MSDPRINGYCPACGAAELVMDYATANLRCDGPGCPRPTAAHEILQDSRTEHEVTFTADGFTLRHPMRERLDDDLLTCEIHRMLMRNEAPPLAPGTYRVTSHAPEWGHADCLVYEPLEGHFVLGPVEGDQDVYPGS